jgi:peptidyl-prolyl cis-trans isomerase C
MSSRRRADMERCGLTFVLFSLTILLSCSMVGERSNEGARSSPVVARANDSVLTMEEFEALIPEDYREYYSLEDKKALINRWIETELVYQEAVRLGLDKEPEIQHKVEEFQRLLLENEIIQRELRSRVKVADEEIEKYYNENPDFFLREKEEVRLSQIVVDSLDLAGALRDQLDTDPSLFSTFAAEYSLEKSGKNNGDVGYYAVDELIDPLKAAVSALKTGEISPVVEVPGYGYFIVTVTDRKGAGTMKALEDVSDEIRDILLVSKEEEERKKWVEGLMSKNDVEVDWQLIEEQHSE